ncbi:hypothetical protein BST81_01100 [Leptolyngbya sp. 'hensonii']|uniref:hypothetical protein n=1 Tax=Leptolyngbya sp. 'hensonii' TaxID=1922337 RepID=UPI00094FDC54|nr:hypothetical protein [Leptolyngbya sp. 'hensonii']OLP20360.1 hypothetical protein BST81_01100 [Leptolyngbya sp. 'hensonii']
MAQNIPGADDREDLQSLNREIDDLYAEVEDLHQQTAMLTGFLAGGYAYFLQRFMLAHQQQTGMTPEVCEQIVVDALKRILSSQKRFEFDFLAEIQTVLNKMSQPIPLDPYLGQIEDSKQQES